MTRHETPDPREVDGFEAAQKQGLLPLVSDTAPTLEIQPPAGAMLDTHIISSVIGFFACVVGILLIDKFLKPPDIVFIGQVVITGSLMFWYWLWKTAKIGEVAVSEFSRGYTTIQRLVFGNFWLGSSRTSWWNDDRIGWDFTGLWRLDPKSGAVIAAPNRTVTPPGFYPSPFKSGKFQQWTGSEWISVYRDANKKMGESF